MHVEACVRVLPKTGTDPSVDYGFTVIGDIIEILPTGSDWGSEIMAHPDYRIITIDEPITTLDSLMQSETGEPITRDLRPRMFQIDPNLVPQPIKDMLAANPDTVSDITAEDVTAMSVRKPDMPA